MTTTDLPLLSNTNEFRVRHYIWFALLDEDEEVIKSRLLLFVTQPSACEQNGSCCTDGCHHEATQSDCSVHSDIHSKTDHSFELILECSCIHVEFVREVICEDFEFQDFLQNGRTEYNDFLLWNAKESRPMTFVMEQFCMRISTVNIEKPTLFPKVIVISYHTSPEGLSLLWRKDQDGNKCCYTPGALINNRSLLPHQDRPCAMATWQAWICTASEKYVCMTGDKSPVSTEASISCTSAIEVRLNGIGKLDSLISVVQFGASSVPLTFISCKCFYYYTEVVLPISTVAFAAGNWTVEDVNMDSWRTENLLESCNQDSVTLKHCGHPVYPCQFFRKSGEALFSVTVVFPPSVRPKIGMLLELFPACLIAGEKLLGVNPNTRLELVFLPNCFANLGFTSPNLIFLSTSVLSSDPALGIRLCHELSHSWFGVSIGAKDWREEWISEGFATYLEDYLYKEAMQIYFSHIGKCKCGQGIVHSCVKDAVSDVNGFMSGMEELFQLRTYLRFRTLKGEVQNQVDDLHILKPPDCQPDAGSPELIANGTNAVKIFLQVHYLKGYFLLQYLSRLVGQRQFNSFVRVFATEYHGQLIESDDFVNSVFRAFPSLTLMGLSKDNIKKSWLETPGLNSVIINFCSLIHNKLCHKVHEHLEYWKSSYKKRWKVPRTELKFTFSDQLVLFLEFLLEETKVPHSILKNIYHVYKVMDQNADVRHRWCELCIKHSFPVLSEVERFLCSDQSMGVYLYGELIISDNRAHKDLARKMFEKLKNELDPNAVTVVRTMLTGGVSSDSSSSPLSVQASSWQQ